MLVPVLEAEPEPLPELEPVALEPEVETAVAKPEAVALALVAVAEEISKIQSEPNVQFRYQEEVVWRSLPTLWPAEVQTLAKNVRAESALLPHELLMAVSVFFASVPQMVARSAGLLVLLERNCQLMFGGLPSLVYGYGDAYPMTDRTQAGVWWAETMLPRATKARARVDLLKNIVYK